MTLLDLQRSDSDSFYTTGGRTAAVRIVIAVLSVVALILYVDGPLAAAVQDLPSALREAVAAVADLAKGKYLIGLAFVAMAAAAIAASATQGARRLAWRAKAVGAGYVFLATLAALALATILKIIFGRSRPELLAVEGPYAFLPFSTAKAYTSFPSGETMMAVAFFGACARLARPRVGWGMAAVVFAPAVALAGARLIVGAHYLSDIVAGALLSLAIVALIFGKLEDRVADRASAA
jgi:membrane-associated phospholipid phosphatase